MPNPFFQFKQFCVWHDRCAMKVTTDGCLFGAWVASRVAGQHWESALDIGTGSGLLSLMVAQQNNCPIDALEIDPEAAQQAAENMAASPWAGQLRVIAGDLLRFPALRQYPLIFSNPPFYEAELAAAHKGRNLAHHSGGLLLKDLFSRSFDLLTTGGSAFFLLPAKREQEIVQMVQQQGWQIVQWVRVHQSAQHAAFRLIVQLSKQPAGETAFSEIQICAAGRQYSAAFTALLKDYYLYL